MSYPDIFFIVLDTQRADRLGCYGHDQAITPNLDHFAWQGVLFEQAIAPGQWTIPSHASMFTGQYPSTHQVTQSSHSLSPDSPHPAEVLQAAGYQTVGFCNNPLVGILNNGFKRGFQTFYNYGGAIPSLPKSSSCLPGPAGRLLEGYTQFLRRISYPIQNFFARSDLAFHLSLNSWLTPLWSRFANFKGQNERSARDVSHFLRRREEQGDDRPLFLFLNLMETHLPFWPPSRYVDRIAPYFHSDKRAQKIMRTWNREAFRWGAPLAEPLSALEECTISDMYDAEVAYQDDYLGEIFEVLERRANRDNTLTIIVSDHGDGLGDHGYFGHAFVAYQELVHVPLILHWPEALTVSQRIKTPVSTRRIYQTILDAAGQSAQTPDTAQANAPELTLLRTINGQDPEDGAAFSEVYPPLNFLGAVQKHSPELIEPFRCNSTRRAVVTSGQMDNTYKLIEVDDQPDELFDLAADPVEVHDLKEYLPHEVAELSRRLSQMAAESESRRRRLTQGKAVAVEDEQLLRQLRGLGYIE